MNVKTCTSFFSQKSLIECGSLSSPPNDGCLQYHTGTTGIIKSFNSGVAAPRIITLAANDINYNICIRQEAGKLAICFLESHIGQNIYYSSTYIWYLHDYHARISLPISYLVTD